jgi:hypothetical protein
MKMVAEEHDADTDEQAEDFTAGLETDQQSESDQSDAAEADASEDESKDDESADAKSDGDDAEAAEPADAKSDGDDAEAAEPAEAKSDGDESDKDGSAEAEAVAEVPEKKKTPQEESEEGEPGDDHPDAIAALKDLGARLDLNKHERVWRIFFYEKHDDTAVDQIHGLSSLKELWLLHTRVTSEAADKVRERLEGVTVHYG